MLPQYISPYIRRLIQETGGEDGPIGRQFIFRPEETSQEQDPHSSFDPQQEHKYQVAPGLVYKYKGKIGPNGAIEVPGRVLWVMSRYCGTYCRYCFRGRLVGTPGHTTRNYKDTLAHKPYLSKQDIDQGFAYIQKHKEIQEVQFSGGDPFVCPRHYLSSFMLYAAELQKKGNIRLVRVHTRAPITNPLLMKDWHYNLLRTIDMPRVILQVNHPAEITPEIRTGIRRLREAGAMLYSQTVLLRGVNDSVSALEQLFTNLAYEGIHPYYLHNNDPVPWARHFTVPFTEAIALWQAVRPRLTGIAATAKFVIDAPHGVGKVVVPEAGWNVDYTSYTDFEGKRHKVG